MFIDINSACQWLIKCRSKASIRLVLRACAAVLLSTKDREMFTSHLCRHSWHRRLRCRHWRQIHIGFQIHFSGCLPSSTEVVFSDLSGTRVCCYHRQRAVIDPVSVHANPTLHLACYTTANRMEVRLPRNILELVILTTMHDDIIILMTLSQWHVVILTVTGL